MLELRQSNTDTQVLIRIFGGSNLVGKGEIPWKAILESPNMEFKKWVKIGSCDDEDSSSTMFSVPEVQVEIKIRVASEKKENSRKRLNKLNECGCKHGHDQHSWCSAEDYQVFAFGAALEAF